MRIRIYRPILTFLVMSAIAFPLFAQVDVLASIKPLGLLAETVVGNRGNVSILLPKGASAHHYQLRYSDRENLSEADIVLWIGKDLETFLAKPISQRQKSTINASLLPGIQWPAAEQEEVRHHHHHSGKNPHLWLNREKNPIFFLFPK